jgi:hypothetical protein
MRLYEVIERLPDGRERIVPHPHSHAWTMSLRETYAAVDNCRWAVMIREVTM